MADEIKQVLGIDATQAMDALKQLDTAFKGFEDRLQSTALRLEQINNTAKETVSQLREIAAAARDAQSALSAMDKKGARSVAPSTRSSGSSPKGAKDKLLEGADAARAFDDLLAGRASNIPGKSDELVASLRKVGVAADDSFTKAAAGAQKFTISWETLTRVVVTQFIVRALSAIRDAMSQAVSEAIEFQKQVSLIKTITPDANFDQIAASVRNLSDEFNLPLIETAQGLYNTLSNQVGNFGESVQFAASAAKFAKATNSSLADSVDLLSGAIRSYGLSVNDSDKVSAIFFTAIDKGRVTADELANAFGRVGPSAKEIGISLEELAAAAATISDKGIATAETLTQFRGIITALTKPTDAMKAKLRELGFASTEAAIATLRLDGLLDALANSTDGTAQGFAKLFPNVRGIGGALSLTGDNLKTFSQNIREAQSNSDDYINQKFGEAIANDGEKITKELNKISNAFTIEFGQALLKAASDFIEFSGGAENVAGGLKVLVPTLFAAAQGIGVMATAMAVLQLKTALALGPVGLMASALTAIVVAAGLAKNAIDSKRLDFAFADTKKLEEDSKKIISLAQKASSDELALKRKADGEIVQASLRRVSEINKSYLKDVENAKSANAAMVADTDKTLDRIVSARSKFIQAIEQAITESRNQVKDSQNRIEDIRVKTDDRQFAFQTQDFTDAQKFFSLTQRASSLANQAEADLLSAFQKGDKVGQDRARSLFGRAEAALSEAQAIGKSAQNRGLEVSALRQLESLGDKQISTEERINQLQLTRQANLDKERQKQEKLLSAIKEQAKVAIDNTGSFDKNGELFDEKELKDREKKRQAAFKSIAEQTLQSNDFNVASALGLGDFVKTIQSDLVATPLTLNFDVESSIQRINGQISQSLGQLDIQLPFLKDLEEAVGRSLRNIPDEIRQAIQEVQGELSSFRQQNADKDIIDLKIDQKKAEVQSLLASINGRDARREQQVDQNSNLLPGKEAIDATSASLRKLVEESNFTKESIAAVASELAKGGQLNTQQFDTDVQQIIAIFAKLRELEVLQTQKAEAPVVDTTKLETFQQLFETINQSNIDGKLQGASAAINATVNPIASITSSAQATADAYERAAAAILSVANTPLPAIQTQQVAFGKANMRHLANGGFNPRGVDTIPAMLSAGETVINSKDSQRFFSQLQAINAGRNPVFRQDGGSVTNIGDINVSVKGGDSSDQTVRSIATKLRRELRRGTSRL